MHEVDQDVVVMYTFVKFIFNVFKSYKSFWGFWEFWLFWGFWGFTIVIVILIRVNTNILETRAVLNKQDQITN